MPVNLDAYFGRIGYKGKPRPSVETLRELVARQTQAIPFENVNPLMGWPVHLDLASLHAKLISEGRGGYCYEQNLLLSEALRAIGFQLKGLGARVLIDRKSAEQPPRTHMLLLVEVQDSPWLVDAGFGGTTPTEPLRLEQDIEQATAFETFRIVARNGGYELQMGGAHTWSSLYWFDLTEHCLADYQVANWFVSTHPESPFRKQLVAARAASGRRYGLRNNRLSIHYADGNKTYHTLESVAELKSALEEAFTLRLPQTPELDERLQLAVSEDALETPAGSDQRPSRSFNIAATR